MAYHDLALLSDDADFLRRCAAARATQPDLTATEDALGWARERRWALAASPGFADAYASALAAGITAPGDREDVITDPQILSAVQAILAPSISPDDIEPLIDSDQSDL